MIFGIGTDIVQIPRIERLLNIYGQHFIDKILSKNEIARLFYLNKDQYGCFVAKRFAAKEAVSKALGIGIGQIGFRDISILNDALGKPVVEKFPHEISNQFGEYMIHLSISDDYPICVAFAVITNN